MTPREIYDILHKEKVEFSVLLYAVNQAAKLFEDEKIIVSVHAGVLSGLHSQRKRRKRLLTKSKKRKAPSTARLRRAVRKNRFR